jgi:hypothetical protein
MLHPIRELAQFMKWADFYVRLRLGRWLLHILAQFINWAEN